jgi:hypothetical protein
MDTALKYSPLVSAVCATVMLLWTMGSVLWAKMTATDRVGPPPGQMRWWKRPIPVMIILACLAWLPSILTQLDVRRSSSDSVKPPPSPDPSSSPPAQPSASIAATLPKLGPLKALSIAKYLGNPRVLPPDIHWAIFITYSPENLEFYHILIGLIRDRIDAWIMDAPDNSADRDAPKFPPPPSSPGIVVHGDNIFNTALNASLMPCFVVGRTDQEIDGLSEWFNRRLSEPERKENRKITWIEIGHGSPWREGNRLSPDCLR